MAPINRIGPNAGGKRTDHLPIHLTHKLSGNETAGGTDGGQRPKIGRCKTHRCNGSGSSVHSLTQSVIHSFVHLFICSFAADRLISAGEFATRLNERSERFEKEARDRWENGATTYQQQQQRDER
ncbi:hypothetical protein niasHS_006559 [Heterodera schachtii]|uniref:Uncharacterized protein n=1 Tax=Heterodera schachtii TaxID=97005 RepID=A0ABD2JHP5_HETSC